MRSRAPVEIRRRSVRRSSSHLLRMLLLIGLPLLIVPVLFPRRVSARRFARTTASASALAARTPGMLAQEKRIQEVVDALRPRLAIPDAVIVSVVPDNKLLVSVERMSDRQNTFGLSVEDGFIDTLSDDELNAVVAHELGHVWIFTHHPYLQTEELANEIALRIIDRTLLESVYDKVWKRVGMKGTLQYLPVQ